MSAPNENQVNLKQYTLSTAITPAEACDRFNANLADCPAVKSVKLNPKNGLLVLKGKLHNYMVMIKDGKVRVSAMFSRLSVIPFALCAGFLCYFAAGAGWGLAEGYFEFEEYVIPLICAGVMALITVAVLYAGKPERMKVLPYIHKTLMSK